MAIISKAIHYSIDAVLLSTLLAGIKRTTGYTPNQSQLPLTSDPTVSSIFKKYLDVGEKVFDYTAALAHTSKYFEQTNPTLGMADNVEAIAKRFSDEVRKNQAKKGGEKGGSWWGGSK